jgi:hypothetical protein
MKNTQNKKTAKIETTTIADKIMTVADVARELNLNEKRARAFLRKNADAYAAFRNQKFTKGSTLYNKCVSLLTVYKTKNKIHTA